MLIAPNLENQEYVITDSLKEYKIPKFFVDPEECKITYTSNNSGLEFVKFDPDKRTFSFHYVDDLIYSGDVSKEYEISVSGSTGSTVQKGTSATFILTVKNPCNIPKYVKLEKTPLPNEITYILKDVP